MNPREMQTSMLTILDGAERLLLGASRLSAAFETFLSEAEQGRHPTPAQIAAYRRGCEMFREMCAPMQGAIEAERRKLGRRSH